MRDDPPITVPPLLSGGVMLTYRCTNRCRHCLDVREQLWTTGSYPELQPDGFYLHG